MGKINRRFGDGSPTELSEAEFNTTRVLNIDINVVRRFEKNAFS